MSRFNFVYPTSDERELPHGCFVRMPSEPPLGRFTAEELLRIRAIFKRITALRVDNPHDAEDLVQETFLTMAAKCPPAVELEKGLLAWGMGVLHRKVGNYYRRSQCHATVELETPQVEWSRWARVPPSAESTVHHAELAALVRAILSGFTPAERAVMDLVLAGASTREIARLLHPERYQNIVNRAHRGRKKLFRELARYGYRATSGRWALQPPASSFRSRRCISVKETGES